MLTAVLKECSSDAFFHVQDEGSFRCFLPSSLICKLFEFQPLFWPCFPRKKKRKLINYCILSTHHTTPQFNFLFNSILFHDIYTYTFRSFMSYIFREVSLDHKWLSSCDFYNLITPPTPARPPSRTKACIHTHTPIHPTTPPHTHTRAHTHTRKPFMC